MLKKIGFCALFMALVVYRIMPHPYNLTPLLSAALFSGLCFKDKRLQYLLPLGSMLVTDLFLGVYHGMLFSYLAVASIIMLGRVLSKQKKIGHIMGASILSSFLFYLISNFGVWLVGGLSYAPNFYGLLECYIAGIPFFQRTLEGTLIFSFAFYAIYLGLNAIHATNQYLPDAYASNQRVREF